MATDRAASAAGSAVQRHPCWADARRIVVVAIIALATGCASLDGAGGARRPAQHAVLDDLAVLIECRGDAGAFARLWTALSATLDTEDTDGEPPASDTWPAWTVREGDGGPYTVELDLPASITVAGHRTRHVAIGLAGATAVVFAHLDGTSPARVARQLGLAREPGESDDVWLREYEPSNGATGFRNLSLQAVALTEFKNGERRAVRGRVVVACELDPGSDFDYE